MKLARERKILGIEISADQLLALLMRHGCLDGLSRDGRPVVIPEDARIVSVVVDPSEAAGDSRLRVCLESDALQGCDWKGLVFFLRLA